MDDFGPAKNLMTMCFTYYHIGKTPGCSSRGGHTWRLQDLLTSNMASDEDFLPMKGRAVRLPRNKEMRC